MKRQNSKQRNKSGKCHGYYSYTIHRRYLWSLFSSWPVALSLTSTMQATPVHAGGNVPTLTADFSGTSRPGHDHDSAVAYIVAAKPAKKLRPCPLIPRPVLRTTTMPGQTFFLSLASFVFLDHWLCYSSYPVANWSAKLDTQGTHRLTVRASTLSP